MSVAEMLRSRILSAQRDIDTLRENQKAELETLENAWQRKQEELESEVRVYAEKLRSMEPQYTKLAAEHKELVTLVESLLGSIDTAMGPRVQEAASPVPTIPDPPRPDENVPQRVRQEDSFIYSGAAEKGGASQSSLDAKDVESTGASARDRIPGFLRGALDRCA